MLGTAKRVLRSPKTPPRSSTAPARRKRSQGRCGQIRAQVDRDHVRLRSREAAGTPGQAGRRGRGDSGSAAHRDRGQGEEGPCRRRHACDPRRGRGRHRRWWRRARLLRAIRSSIAKIEPGNDDVQRVGIDIVRKRPGRSPARQIAENAGEDGSIVVGKMLDAKDAELRLRRRRTRTYKRPGQGGHHRPDQGGADSASGRGLGRGLAGDHRSHGCRKAQGRGPRDAGRPRPRHGRNGRNGRLLSPARP